MEDYTKEDVIEVLVALDFKSRKRYLVDQRSYLIGILAYRFMMTEHQIATAVGIKRDMVNYNKRLAIQFQNDKAYNCYFTYIYILISFFLLFCFSLQFVWFIF